MNATSLARLETVVTSLRRWQSQSGASNWPQKAIDRCDGHTCDDRSAANSS